jgi:catechol 2,3-dioxygenase-like lactoylglutathione lyase family enzyme
MVITRRLVLERAAGLPFLVAFARAEGLFRATELNHLFVRARDPERSRAFYEKLFGPPKRRLASGSVLFEFGSSEVGIGAIPNRPIGIDHFCISVEGFSMETAGARLRSQRLTPERLYADDELYFRDPDGILVQLAAPKYRNPRALAIEPSPNPVQALFAPLSLDHLALRVSNLERATGFYEALFGPSRRQSDRPLAGIRTASGQVVGWGTDGVSPIGVDHVCVAIAGYDPDAVCRKLQQNGISSERLYRSDQVFIRDPDGVLVQLSGPGGGIPDRPAGD